MSKAIQYMAEIIASIVISLILTLAGVPSITDIGILLISGVTNALNQAPNAPSQITSYSNIFIFELRLMGAFVEIEAVLRLFMFLLTRQRQNSEISW